MDESTSLRLEIARELHDGIAQEVVALGYLLDEEIGRRATPDVTREQLRKIRTRITTLSGIIRDEIFQLRGLDPRPFSQVIESLAEAIFTESDFILQVDLENDVAEKIRPALIKIIQEILINAKVHSHAKNIGITQSGNSLSVRDDGTGGFKLNSDRWGIAGMQERAAEIGAIIEFTSDEFGTQVKVTWESQA
jgi:signal transduction histidine kinase